MKKGAREERGGVKTKKNWSMQKKENGPITKPVTKTLKEKTGNKNSIVGFPYTKCVYIYIYTYILSVRKSGSITFSSICLKDRYSHKCKIQLNASRKRSPRSPPAATQTCKKRVKGTWGKSRTQNKRKPKRTEPAIC